MSLKTGPSFIHTASQKYKNMLKKTEWDEHNNDENDLLREMSVIGSMTLAEDDLVKRWSFATLMKYK